MAKQQEQPQETSKHIERSIELVQYHEQGRTLGLKLTGYEVGEKVIYPIASNSKFEFVVNGDEPQILRF